MIEDKKTPVVLSLNLSQPEAQRFLEALADPNSSLRRGLVGDDPKAVLAEHGIVVADEGLGELQLPEPEEIEAFLDGRLPERVPPMDGTCRAWSLVYAAGGTANDES